MRVASLTPSNTEIVAFLERADDLVAVDAFSDWPPGLDALEDLGPDLDIDVDHLASLEPDLVLAAESVPGMEAVTQALESAGLEHVVLAPGTLADIFSDVRRVSELLGVPERGAALADAMADEIDRIRALASEQAPVRVYWEWWPTPPITAGGTGWTHEVIAAAGGVDVFGDRAAQSLEVTLEEVRAAKPEVVAMCWQGTLAPVQSAEHIRKREGWDALPPVSEGSILELPEHLFGRPGPRIVEGVRRLASELHPDLRDELGPAYGWLPGRLADRLPLDP